MSLMTVMRGTLLVIINLKYNYLLFIFLVTFIIHIYSSVKAHSEGPHGLLKGPREPTEGSTHLQEEEHSPTVGQLNF